MNEKVTSYSGGLVLSGTEVWNRDPLPKPPPPKVWQYKLTMQHVNGHATATATTMEMLISFETQMRQLGYEFIKLERLDPDIPQGTNETKE